MTTPTLRGLCHAALIGWTLIVIIPLLWTFLSSLKSEHEIFAGAWQLPETIRLDNYARAWTDAGIGRYFWNSVLVVSISTALTMILGAMAAYVLARYRFVGSKLIYFYFVGGLACPIYLALTPLFFVVKNLGRLPLIGGFIGLNTHAGLILVYVAISLPFTIFFLTAFFRTLPSSVAEAAMIDGASHARIFVAVMLPMARGGMISIAIFNILGQWNQYLLPLVLLSGDESRWVLTQGVANIVVSAGYEADYAGLFAALMMAILPMLVVYTIFQRQIQGGLTAGAVR